MQSSFIEEVVRSRKYGAGGRLDRLLFVNGHYYAQSVRVKLAASQLVAPASFQTPTYIVVG